MRKRNAVSKAVRERICKLPWRHQDTRFNVVRLGHQSPSLRPRPLVQHEQVWCRVSSLDHRLALATKAPGKQRLSATKSPRRGHRHHLSRSVTTAPSSLSELLTKRGLLPRTECRCLSTPSRRVTRRVQVFACRSKTSLKGALARTNP